LVERESWKIMGLKVGGGHEREEGQDGKHSYRMILVFRREYKGGGAGGLNNCYHYKHV